MKTKETVKSWYVGQTGNHQGLVIDENTGANIAVTYDKADAPLVAAAPELLRALRLLRDWDSDYISEDEVLNIVACAIANAEGK